MKDGNRLNTYCDICKPRTFKRQKLTLWLTAVSGREPTNCNILSEICKSSHESRCPTTYPNHNHSRWMSNLNHVRVYPDCWFPSSHYRG